MLVVFRFVLAGKLYQFSSEQADAARSMDCGIFWSDAGGERMKLRTLVITLIAVTIFVFIGV
ncbi:MAG: hypothetical protein ACM3ZQ_11565, partial [Bacillota bacterium]